MFVDRQASSSVADNSFDLIQPSSQMRWIHFPDLIWETDMVSACVITVFLLLLLSAFVS